MAAIVTVAPPGTSDTRAFSGVTSLLSYIINLTLLRSAKPCASFGIWDIIVTFALLRFLGVGAEYQ